MKKFFEQFWCALRGHGGIDVYGYGRGHGQCKRCGATVDLE